MRAGEQKHNSSKQGPYYHVPTTSMHCAILQVSDFLCRDQQVNHVLMNHDGIIQQAV